MEADFKLSQLDQVLTIISGKCIARHGRTAKARRQTKRIPHYPNCVATFQLLMTSGDISPSPGSVSVTVKPAANNRRNNSTSSVAICPQCEKSMGRNHKRFLCEVCILFTHARCSGAACTNLKQIRADMPVTWTCDRCTLSTLPFHACPELDTTVVSHVDETITDEIHEILNSNNNQLKVMHLNTQSMMSTFNEFLLTTKTYPMDVALLSETWLRNHKELLDHVAIEGYVTEFRHREVTKGGGVGAYIKDNIPYKRRYDIENIQPSMEHLWLELPGRNKHSKLLLGVIYRSNLLITASNWLECFEDLLTHVTSTWDGMVVLAGDTNFNLLIQHDRLVSRYNTILDIFGIDLIVTKPTRVTKTS